MILENMHSAKSPVQVCRETTTRNGCRVTMIFPESSPGSIRLDVAVMLLAAFVRRRSCSI